MDSPTNTTILPSMPPELSSIENKNKMSSISNSALANIRIKGFTKGQVAKGLAALYDDEELEIKLSSPILRNSNKTIFHTVEDAVMPDTPVSTPSEPQDIRYEWTGTSDIHIQDNYDLQAEKKLQCYIDNRSAICLNLLRAPYDPQNYLSLSIIDNQLAFCDIAASNAYKALTLIEIALSPPSSSKYTPLISLPSLRNGVLSTLFGGICTTKKEVIYSHLKSLQREAYEELLKGLIGCGAFWDGLVQAKKARMIFPRKKELERLEAKLKDRFRDQTNEMKEAGYDNKKTQVLSRVGKIYQKRYPWLDEMLYVRTREMVQDANNNLKLATENKCEIRPVVFGTPKVEEVIEGKDVGPLGLFATKDIRQGDIILLDHTLLCSSSVSSSRFYHCDACNSCLLKPILQPDEIIRPTCCCSVAFCSVACRDSAVNGYHKSLCGKNTDWIFNSPAAPQNDDIPATWQALLLRLMAIIHAEKKSVHPLQHQVLGLLSANYTESTGPCDWQFYENVVAPTKMLLQLGIDIFKSRDWDPEVIQTVIWRINNNASRSSYVLNLDDQDIPAKRPTITMIKVNPNYIFFNHSCFPNVSWNTYIFDPYYEIVQFINSRGHSLARDQTSVTCKASRDIKAGEELKISYIGDPLGSDGRAKFAKLGIGRYGEMEPENEGRSTMTREDNRAWLEKWFTGGCGCDLCEWENNDTENVVVNDDELPLD